MKRIAYYSKSAPFLTKEDREEMASAASRRNRTGLVTGLLVYSNGTFFQVIEGDSDTVDKLFQKILSDKRHSDINKVLEEEITSRLFKNWAIEITEFANTATKSMTMDNLEKHGAEPEIIEETTGKLMQSLSFFYKTKRLFFSGSR